MRRYLIRRLIFLVATLFVVSVLAFLMPYLTSSDPARTILRGRVDDPAIDPDTVAAIRVELGLDQPLPIQYVRWLANAARGDFGLSFQGQEPVIELVAKGLSVSIVLACVTIAVAFLIAFPLGILAALRPGGAVDRATAVFAQVVVAVPTFALGPIAILVFAVWLKVLPSAGWSGPQSAVLPVIVLGLRPTAYFLRVTRASMLTVLGSEYVLAARARGASQLYTVVHHVARNGMLPVMTLSSFWLAGLMGGSIIVEVIFAIPGMGRLVYGAVTNSDIVLLQGCLVCIVALTVTISTLTDVAYAYINPAITLDAA